MLEVRDMNVPIPEILHYPITEEEWDILMDSDMENTDKITFVVRDDKRVEFVKKKTGKWLPSRDGTLYCSSCTADAPYKEDAYGYVTEAPKYEYCPHCGAKME